MRRLAKRFARLFIETPLGLGLPFLMAIVLASVVGLALRHSPPGTAAYEWQVANCNRHPELSHCPWSPTPTSTLVATIPTPTAIATPTPTPRPTIIPPSGMGPQRVVVAAPPPIDIAYADWYVVTLAFPPAEQYRALRTAWCESRFIDDERGAAGEAGRFQIMLLWLAEPGVQEIIESWFPGATGSLDTMIAALEHPHVNAQVAAWIQERNGWGPWTTRFGCSGWQG